MTREPSKEDAPSLGHLVKQIDVTWGKKINNILREHDLTRSQAFVLHRLEHHHEGSASLKELEAEVGVAQSTVWGLAKRLEEKGLIRLETDPTDARARLAVLTDAGYQECSSGWRCASQFQDRLDEEFSPEEQERFRGYLERMLAVAQEEEPRR